MGEAVRGVGPSRGEWETGLVGQARPPGGGIGLGRGSWASFVPGQPSLSHHMACHAWVVPCRLGLGPTQKSTTQVPGLTVRPPELRPYQENVIGVSCL